MAFAPPLAFSPRRHVGAGQVANIGKFVSVQQYIKILLPVKDANKKMPSLEQGHFLI